MLSLARLPLGGGTGLALLELCAQHLGSHRKAMTTWTAWMGDSGPPSPRTPELDHRGAQLSCMRRSHSLGRCGRVFPSWGYVMGPRGRGAGGRWHPAASRAIPPLSPEGHLPAPCLWVALSPGRCCALGVAMRPSLCGQAISTKQNPASRMSWATLVLTCSEFS